MGRIALLGADWAHKILHVDLDAFYPSVEALDAPELVGKPVIVGGLGPRGVVASASYEAREHGVHSAMPMARARRLCPDAVYLRPRFDRYREISRRIFRVYEAWTDKVEPLSMDEAYLDVSRHVSSPVDIAKAIKSSIRRHTGLTASAGVSVNKFLAKLASDIQKPDGLMVIRPEQAADVLRDLPVGKLWGVGPASVRLLNEAGFETIGQVAAASPERLVELLGRWGERAWEFANGRDDRAVEPPGEPKSISSETTYDADLRSWDEAWPTLERFAQELEERLHRWGLHARTVTLKVRFHDFTTITRSYTPPASVHDAGRLLEVARHLTRKVALGRRRLRLVGLGVSNMVDPDAGAGGRGSGARDAGARRQLLLWDADPDPREPGSNPKAGSSIEST